MPDQAQHSEKKTFLEPSWKQFFLSWLISFLAIPLFGIGLIGLYITYKRQNKVRYVATDRRISSIDAKYRRNIDLVNIASINVKQDWLQEKLGIGDLVLETSAAEMVLAGMDNPYRLKEIVEHAVEAEKQRQRQEQENKPRQPEYEPGSMDKMDYLTGLWQQGLISDEDYKKERKHFE